MDWSTFASSVVVSLVGSSVLAALITSRSRRQGDERKRVNPRADAVHEVLGELDLFYKRATRKHRKDDLRRVQESRLRTEVSKLADESLDGPVADYLAYGPLFMAKDEDYGVAGYEERLQAVRSAVRRCVQKVT